MASDENLIVKMVEWRCDHEHVLGVVENIKSKWLEKQKYRHGR